MKVERTRLPWRWLCAGWDVAAAIILMGWLMNRPRKARAPEAGVEAVEAAVKVE